MSLTFTQQKKPSSTLIPAKRGQSGHQATFQPPRAEEAPPQPGFGHEFSQVDVHSGGRTGQQFASSCPLALASPRACPFGGACHSCPAPIQAKLAIGQPDDRYEQEADRVADAVMTMPEPLNRQRLQRECSECEDEAQRQEVEEGEQKEEVAPKLIQRQAKLGGPEEEEKLLTAAAKVHHGHKPVVSPGVAADIQALRSSGGQPLPTSTRAFFEPRFGHDFFRVRVHTDSKAADTAKAVQAKAFTVGRDIVFGGGQYAPDSQGGRRLLAHELAHVVQQVGTENAKSMMQAPIATTSPGDRLEAEPDRAGLAVRSGESVHISNRLGPSEEVVARQDACPSLGQVILECGFSLLACVAATLAGMGVTVGTAGVLVAAAVLAVVAACGGAGYLCGKLITEYVKCSGPEGLADLQSQTAGEAAEAAV